MAGRATGAVLFVDTSAAVRRYDRTEPGAARVRSLCRRPAGNRLVLARLTPVEMASALNRKVRERVITQAQRDRIWRLFAKHRRDQYHEMALDEQVYRRAEQLLVTHPLRAYDALQVAAALVAARLLGDLAPFRFCTADRMQAQAARAEGLDVELIA